MNQPPLNPDALDNLAQVVLGISTEEWNEHDEDEKRQALAPYTRIIETYLAAALPEVTSVEELDQLPHGAIIMATGGNWNPEHPELFLKCGYAHAPWMALDPSDRDDGENLESSGAVLKWRCDGSARVLYRPEVKP